MKTKLVYFLVAIFASFTIISCNRDNDDSGSGSYPKQVSVVYKVTSTTTSAATLVQYKNETGANVDVPNATLPYTKTFNRTVNKNDVLALSYGTNTNQTVKLEILVNNVSVKTQTFTSTAGAITYTFN